MTEFEDNLKRDVHNHDPRNVLKDTIAQSEANAAAVIAEAEGYFAKKYDQAARDKAAKEGAALPDGSFPIYDQGDLDNAVSLVGNYKGSGNPRAHIKKRAATLKLKMPSSYSAAETEGEPDEERRELILQCPNCGLVQSAVSTDFCSNCNQDLRDQDPAPLTGNPAAPAEQPRIT